MAGRARASSLLWGRGYDPCPPEHVVMPPGLRYRAAPKPLPADPMADYVQEGAQWWLARGEKSPYEIQRKFDKSGAGCVLYETVGAITQLGRAGRHYVIGIQLTRAGEWDVDLCLAEIGIYLEELWNGGKGPESW